MISSSLPPVIFIKSENELTDWVRHCSACVMIGVDSESDSFHHYHEKVCLIQMSAGGRDAIVDTLALKSCEPLREVFEQSTCVKIFHDAGFDLMGFWRDFQMTVTPVFDTMLASRLLGEREFGLAAVIKKHFNWVVNKKLQRSDWSKRPLSAEQLRYAQTDTHFLEPLAQQLQKQLVKKGRWQWAEEDFGRLPTLAKQKAERLWQQPDIGFWRLKGLRRLTAQEKGRAQVIYDLRERWAKKYDQPRFRIFRDEVLIDLAKEPPASWQTFYPRPGLSQGAIERYGRELVTALLAAKPCHVSAPNHGKSTVHTRSFADPMLRARYKRLKAVRGTLAQTLGIDPEMVLSNAVLETLAQRDYLDPTLLTSHPELIGWRKNEILSKMIQAMEQDQ